jgi:hypothetical protein
MAGWEIKAYEEKVSQISFYGQRSTSGLNLNLVRTHFIQPKLQGTFSLQKRTKFLDDCFLKNRTKFLDAVNCFTM